LWKNERTEEKSLPSALMIPKTENKIKPAAARPALFLLVIYHLGLEFPKPQGEKLSGTKLQN